MKRFKKKYIFIPVGLLLILAMLAYGTYQLMNSRTVQLFGKLVSRVATDQKVVALTFDDAPGPQLNDILALLTQRQVQATFYEIGQQMEKYPQEANAITRAGMEPGNHSYSHERMVFKSMSFYQNEVERTNTLIRATGYTGEITFRPPNGKKLAGLPWYLSQHNILTITWDVEPDTYEDTGTGSGDANYLVQYTLTHTKPGSIILLHPFCSTICAADRAAIPGIIDGLRARGYTFVTISQLLTYAK